MKFNTKVAKACDNARLYATMYAESDKFEHVHYSDLEDIARSPILNLTNVPLVERAQRGGDAGVKWLGVETAAELYRLLDTGWEDGLKRAGPLGDGLDLPKLPDVRRKRTRSDFGHELDIHRIYAGKTDTAWLAMERRGAMTTKKRVHLFCNVAGNCGTSSEELMWRGIACAVLSEGLEELGYRVQISTVIPIIGHTYETRTKHKLVTCTIKNYGETLTLDYVLAALGLSGVFRTFGFKAIANDTAEVCSSLGHTGRLEGEFSMALDAMDDHAHQFLVDGFRDLEGAQKFLVNVAERLQCNDTRLINEDD